jgi:hypothetical protein
MPVTRDEKNEEFPIRLRGRPQVFSIGVQSCSQDVSTMSTTFAMSATF